MIWFSYRSQRFPWPSTVHRHYLTIFGQTFTWDS
jgi:hypothetical protein